MSAAEGQVRKRGFAVNFVGVSVLVLFMLGLVVRLFGPDDPLQFARKEPVFWIVASAAAAIGSLTVGTIWMRSIDELAQRAHYVAWYWGGSLGITVVAFLVLAAPALAHVIDFPALAAVLSPVGGEAAEFSAGVIVSALAMVLGYGVWWLVYWLRKQ